MSKRSASESVARILVAFVRQRTWSQADLAREIEVTPKALRLRLEELSRASVPLEREEDWPHVYWSVPRSWFPGGTVLESADGDVLARLVARLPRSAERERVMRRLLGASTAAGAGNAAKEDAAPGVLEAAEDSCGRRLPLFIRSFSAGRGEVGTRHISVHRVEYGPHVRVLATCHRSGALKWFRADRIEAARLDPKEPFRDADAAEVERHLAESVDGFHGSGAVVECSFFVRTPEARWVARNLPAAMTAEHTPDGVRLSMRTSAVETLARFVAGLGGAARVETPELRRRVVELAAAAVEANAGQRVVKVNSGAVGRKRATG